MGAAMYAAAEADQAAAGGANGATGESDDDVVDAEIVDGRPRATPPRVIEVTLARRAHLGHRGVRPPEG